MQCAMPRQFLRFDGQRDLEIRRPLNPNYWARILMFSISDVKSIRPDPLVGRFDNDGSGRSPGKGVKRMNGDEDLNPAVWHNERLVILNLQESSFEELEVVDVAYERLDERMLN